MEIIKILIIDDNLSNTVFLQNILNSDECFVSSALSAMDGIERAKFEEWDLILLDVSLYDMDGYKVCKLLKSNDRTKDIPVIFLTVENKIDNKVAGLNTGAVDYIDKPFHPRELKARINSALRTKKIHDDLKAQIYELEEKIITDELTKVYNRLYIYKRLNEEINRSKRFNTNISCLVLDLDHFKRVNDKYGHLTGDTVLIEFAKVLRTQLRSVDMIGRYGGEEFVIVLPQTAKDGALNMAERLRKCVEDFHFSGPVNEVIRLTTSIGVATIGPDDTINSKDFFQMADNALYEAKKENRNRVIFWEKKI